MREQEIRTWTAALRKSFGAPRAPVALAPLQALFDAKSYTPMIRSISDTMRLHELGLRIGYVNSGGPANAPMWVDLPEPMPMFGSEAFRRLRVPFFVRKSFLAHELGPVVMGLSHECAHIILNSTGNALRRIEEVVDLTAMHLGFRHVYAKQYSFEVPSQFPTEPVNPLLRKMFERMAEKGLSMSETHFTSATRLGYLWPDERKFAATLME